VPTRPAGRRRRGQAFEWEVWGIAGDTQTQQIVQIIAQSWSQIGVKTSPQFQDVSTIWGPEGYQFNEKMTACLYSWYSGNDPDDSSTGTVPDSRQPDRHRRQHAGLLQPLQLPGRDDRLTAAGAAETDQEKRKEIYFQIQELLHNEVPVIFIYWGKAFPAITEKLGALAERLQPAALER
jgi:peptide/nickel transport system substrate-binding protein